MANLSITTDCNRQCGYCFAGRLPSRNQLRREHFQRVLDLLERSGVEQVRLLGGEPTLHPDFPELAQCAVDRGFTIMVFSNGRMPEASLQALVNLPAERCGVLLNVRCPNDDTLADRRDLAHVCQALGPRASVGINIYRPGLSLSFVLALIEEFQLRRSLRLGLAHPRLGGNNEFLRPKFYPLVGQDLLNLAYQTRECGVTLDLDCGFVPCMFPSEFWAVAGLTAADVGQRCGPIPDILPDLSAIHCYALGALERYPISGIGTVAELRQLHHARYRDARRLGIYRVCASCQFKQSGQCRGGCLAAAMRRLDGQGAGQGGIPRPTSALGNGRKETSAVTVRAVTPDHQGEGDMLWPGPNTTRESPSAGHPQCWSLPYIDQPTEFWQALAADYPSRIQAIYFPLPQAGVGSGRPPQPAEYLTAFLKQDAIGKAALINPIVLPRPVREIGPLLVDQLAQLVEEYNLSGATIADLQLGEMIRHRLPRLELTASVLMDIHQPHQVQWLNGLFDVLVPATRILRRRRSLLALRRAFSGRLRLLVNEGCLAGCPFRQQHFYEMAAALNWPESLCHDLLQRQPWLDLTGAWVLPQHLAWFDEVAEDFKLAGRVTLRCPDAYRRVCDAYLHRTALWPHEIGGGPASMHDRLNIPDDFFQQTLACEQQCHQCDLCKRFAARRGISPTLDESAVCDGIADRVTSWGPGGDVCWSD